MATVATQTPIQAPAQQTRSEPEAPRTAPPRMGTARSGLVMAVAIPVSFALIMALTLWLGTLTF